MDSQNWPVVPSGQKHVQSLSKNAPFLHVFTLGQCSLFKVKEIQLKIELKPFEPIKQQQAKLTSTLESRIGQLNVKKTERSSLAHKKVSSRVSWSQHATIRTVMQYAKKIVLHVEIVAVRHFGVLFIEFSLYSVVIHNHMCISVISCLFMIEAHCVSEFVNYISDLLLIKTIEIKLEPLEPEFLLDLRSKLCPKTPGICTSLRLPLWCSRCKHHNYVIREKYQILFHLLWEKDENQKDKHVWVLNS